MLEKSAASKQNAAFSAEGRKEAEAPKLNIDPLGITISADVGETDMKERAQEVPPLEREDPKDPASPEKASPEVIERDDVLPMVSIDKHCSSSSSEHDSCGECSCPPAKEVEGKTPASCKCSDKMEKWRKRDIAKHLAGERSRRQKRMNRLYQLRDILGPFKGKPSMNTILQQAVNKVMSYLWQSSPTRIHFLRGRRR